jgi:hypothetical protein
MSEQQNLYPHLNFNNNFTNNNISFQSTTTSTILLAQRLSPLLYALLKSFHAIPVRLKVFF